MGAACLLDTPEIVWGIGCCHFSASVHPALGDLTLQQRVSSQGGFELPLSRAPEFYAGPLQTCYLSDT